MMMDLINAIPESVGWVFVGATGMAACIMFSLIIKTIIEMARDYLINDEMEDE